MFQQLGLIGCGLIGGSFALALKRAGMVKRVVGYSKSPSTTERARKLGVIDVAAESALRAVAGSDIVLIAVPVAATETTFKAIRDLVEPGVLFMDVGSTKRDVVDAARRVLRERIRSFVPAHPIAGREVSGVEHADAALFSGRQVILTPLAQTAPELVQKATDAWSAVGAQVLKMTAENHDAAFAAVSHLPHLLAFAYFSAVVNQPAGRDYLSLAGPGFRDFTRIAASSPETWRDILVANREEVLKQSQRFRHALDALEHVMRSGNAEALEDLIRGPAEGRARWRWARRACPGRARTEARRRGPRGAIHSFARPPCSTFRTSTCRRCAAPSGTVRLPGSKSISNRVLLLAGLAEGTTAVHDLLDSDDTRVMLDALAALGCGLRREGARAARHGPGWPAGGARGTALPGQRRHRHAAAGRRAGGAGGHARRPLRAQRRAAHARAADRRPGRRACARWAAPIEDLGTPGYPPLRISGQAGGRLATDEPIRVRGDVSSQFLTALLLALPLVAQDGDVVVEVDGELISKPYVEITLALLARFGIEVAARRLAALHRAAGQPLPHAGQHPCRRRRLVGLVLRRAGRHRRTGRGAAAHRGRGQRLDPGRHPLRRRGAGHGRRGHAAGPAGCRCTAGAGRWPASRWTATTSPTPP